MTPTVSFGRSPFAVLFLFKFLFYVCLFVLGAGTKPRA